MFDCLLDLGAKGSCMIGGNVSTNAGENGIFTIHSNNRFDYH